MQLCSWPGAPYGLALLAFLFHCVTAVERRYYIAAVNVDWDYTSDVQQRTRSTYRKIVYREYDEGFTKAKTHPSSSGLLGPTLRGQSDDTIIVTFKNKADRPCSIHPHGIAYGKQSEGSLYFDNTSQFEKEDDVIYPGEEHTYYWDVTSEVAPMAADPPCITYTYLSHVDIVKDYNSGLIGTMLICKKGALDDSGNQIHFHQEAVLLFGVFDENISWYSTGGPPQSQHIKYTINGYTNGSVPDLGICAYSKVSWHLLGMSSEPELFSVHFNGQVLMQNGHKTSAVGIISGSATSASMSAVYPGRWLFSSHISKHLEAGLHGYLNIRTCEEFQAPKRRLTIQQREESQEWTYYIAAEEIIWDYAPNMLENMDGDFRSKYLKQGPYRIGKKYKKAVFTLYKDGTFKERAEEKQRKKELGILGPVIRAQIRDVIKIVFKNKASRPYSIYPHGLTINKSAEGASYPEGGNQTHGIEPGETYTYVWNVGEEDVPTDSDSRCLTRMYHSAVNTPRDIASGLVGPLLICKSQSLNKKNVQLKADKEQHAMFSVFDENKSWYIDENINTYCSDPKKVKRDSEFYKSNVMHTINGYVYESGQELGFCHGEIVTWHVSSVGEQDYIQTATFYGHTFELKNREEDMLNLFPMTGETISMNMVNIGIWLLASMNSHDSTKGMRVKFKDLECFRDYVMEYDYDTPETFTELKTSSITEIVKETAKPIKPDVVDEYSDYFAGILGMRSFRNQNSDVNSSVIETQKETANTTNSTVADEDTEYYADLLGLKTLKDENSDVELLDLSFQDHDDGIFLTEEVGVVQTDDLYKSQNTSSTSSNQTYHLSVDSAGLDRHFSNHSVVNESTIDESLHITSYFDSDSEIMASNETDSIKSHFSENRHIRSASIEAINITESISSNSTYFPAIVQNASMAISSFNLHENISLKMATETDSVSTNTTHLLDYLRYTTLLEPVNETHSFHSNTSDGGSYNTTDNYTTSLYSNDEKILNKTFEHLNKTDVNATNIVDVNSGNVFIYNIPSSDSLSNTSESQEEDFVLLDIKKNSKDDISLTFLKNSTLEALDNNSDPIKNTTVTNRTSAHINETLKPNGEILINASSPSYLDNLDNVSISLSPLNASSTNSSEWLPEDSLEEVAIYLQDNLNEVILTSPLKPDEENWGYDGKHETVPMEMPDHVKKYITDEPTEKAVQTPKKKKKVVHKPVKPRKGHGMKTKKRKEYKPQALSEASPLGLSPRGFGPPVFNPRGTRPVSSEEDLMSKSIVIGVPRRDFNDYDLYVPKQELENDSSFLDKSEEYEFVEYIDPYSKSVDIQNMAFDVTSQHFLNEAEDKDTRTYFIAAEEEEWDYAGYGQRRFDKLNLNERPTAFKKVVFRRYLDSSFTIRDIRGEMDEHLGILGPVIKAEVDQTIMIFFRNHASRPYSLHANGVKYLKQTEGLSYDDQSPYWYKQDDAVQPNSSFVYMWTISPKSGPQNNESDCRTWAYYSGVNSERDINSGLIGPLLVCRKGTLVKPPVNRREFILLFMTFNENKSWYYEENRARIERKNKRIVLDPNFNDNLKFDAINGIIYSLKGLRMYTNQVAKWHLINMGSPKDLHSVHFHGQTFINKELRDYRQGVYPLLPGGFGTLEMLPSKPGLWQLESEVGLSQQRGMQTLFLVLDNVCDHPLGLISGTVKDEHITASNTRGQWSAHLARLRNTGKYNAWSTAETGQYIQVDFQRPVVISKVATQGAKQLLKSQFVLNYTISYSTDKKKWIYYKGDSDAVRKTFEGNSDAYEEKENIFFPPLIGRYVRLHPLHSYNYPTVRLEYFGCELDGCSVPMGMQSGSIKDNQITASSVAQGWYSGQWHPWYARLNKQGTTNAWQAKNNDLKQWIQVELPVVKKITGIITQGAKRLGTEMFVTEFMLEYSEDGRRWTKYTEDEDSDQKNFKGNTDNNGQVKNYIFPPIFSRFIRVVPKRWQGSITMRIELLGCDFE